MMELNVIYLLVFTTVIAWFYRKLTQGNDYFHDKPIPSMVVRPFLGSTGPLMSKKYSMSDYCKMIYDKFEGVKVFGLFDTTQRVFVMRDPELIKKVAIKDFDYFVDRRPWFGDAEIENPNMIFSKMLLGMRGQKWRDMRATLSPAFTGSKMRAMFELVTEYTDRMVQIVRSEASAAGYIDLEMKDFFTRIANDIIATCAFGLKVESVKDRENDFYTNGKKMLNFNRVIVLVKTLSYRFLPGLMNKLRVDVLDSEHLHYFAKIIFDTIGMRETHGIVRPDMIQLLMQARKGTLKHQEGVVETGAGFATVEESQVGKTKTSKMITESELIAQCLVFFLAGFETISSGFMFMAYELALDQDVQQRLYEEVIQTKKLLDGKPLSYDVLQKMTYMDMVVSESLRMWPVPIIDRYCVRSYSFDDGHGLQFTIDKGSCLWFPVHGIHHDPKYYPNPGKFDPERFSEANKGNINPSAYLPFGVGPRNCIGSRFALMEMKAIMYQLMLNFSFERNEKTQVPVQLSKGLVGLASEGGIHLRLKLRI